jgi:hypothetical protein
MSADKEKLDQDQEAVSCSWSGVELSEQSPCVLQVERVETLSEPAVDRGQKIVGLLRIPSITPQPSQARRGAKLPGLCLLLASDGDGTLEIRLRFRRGGLGGSWRAP